MSFRAVEYQVRARHLSHSRKWLWKDMPGYRIKPVAWVMITVDRPVLFVSALSCAMHQNMYTKWLPARWAISFLKAVGTQHAKYRSCVHQPITRDICITKHSLTPLKTLQKVRREIQNCSFWIIRLPSYQLNQWRARLFQKFYSHILQCTSH